MAIPFHAGSLATAKICRRRSSGAESRRKLAVLRLSATTPTRPAGPGIIGPPMTSQPIDQRFPRERPSMAARSRLNRGSTTSENRATAVRAHPIGTGLIIIIFTFWRSRLRTCRSGTSRRVRISNERPESTVSPKRALLDHTSDDRAGMLAWYCLRCRALRRAGCRDRPIKYR